MSAAGAIIKQGAYFVSERCCPFWFSMLIDGGAVRASKQLDSMFSSHYFSQTDAFLLFQDFFALTFYFFLEPSMNTTIAVYHVSLKLEEYTTQTYSLMG